ncbi:MAG: pilus assembly PilX N-terminal domain-containing protein [Syntrophobacteraceae bacterium]
MRNPIQNQKGIALIATLMLMVLGFAIVAILFGLSTQETKLARLEQGYTTALNAAKAGTDLFLYMRQNNTYTPPSAPFGTSPNSNCLAIKMLYPANNPPSNPPANWSNSSYQGQKWSSYGCPTQANAQSTFPTAPTDVAGYYQDLTLTLSNYTVYVKVIDNWQTAATGTPPCQVYGCNYYTVISRAVSPDLSEHAEVFFVYRWGW